MEPVGVSENAYVELYDRNRLLICPIAPREKSASADPVDVFIEVTDQALRTLAGVAVATRERPGGQPEDDTLSVAEKQQSIRLMRINHAGEVAAQGLYQGQALTARTDDSADHMKETAHEEIDHLAWCKQRLDELGGRTSLLAPLWYFGALAIGAAAGVAGDRWSLGFVKETEDQVVEHLESHLAGVPLKDKTTLAIIERIKRDEAEHAQAARQAGAAELPQPVKSLMRMAAKVMTTTANYL